MKSKEVLLFKGFWRSMTSCIVQASSSYGAVHIVAYVSIYRVPNYLFNFRFVYLLNMQLRSK